MLKRTIIRNIRRQFRRHTALFVVPVLLFAGLTCYKKLSSDPEKSELVKNNIPPIVLDLTERVSNEITPLVDQVVPTVKTVASTVTSTEGYLKDSRSKILEKATSSTVANENIPGFSEYDLSTSARILLSEKDSLGRCGVAFAVLGPETLSNKERGSIGHVKPTGWKQAKYPGIVNSEPPYLYNRCHLIAYCLTGGALDVADERNLITGTRYMNVEGMEPYELAVLDYIRKTQNHVLYRTTPIFEGDDLLAKGVQIEALSVEDQGEGICFSVYCPNIQPGIILDYSTGESRSE